MDGAPCSGLSLMRRSVSFIAIRRLLNCRPELPATAFKHSPLRLKMNHESPTGYSPRYRFAAIVGLLILSIALRPAIVSIGPILLLIQQHFQLSYAQASLLTSIPDICMGVCALLAPGISRRFGTDHAVVAALVLLAVATVMRALSLSADMLLLSTVLVGIGIAVAGSLIGGWIKTHFPQHAALFMGVYAAGLSLGATAAATSTEFFTAWGNNWRIGAGIWALLCVTAIVSWVLLARRFASARAAATPHKAAAERLPWKNTQAWLIAIYFGLSQFIVYAFFAWLAPAAAQMGLSTLRPGVLLGLFTGVFAIASLTTGALPGQGQCLDRPHVVRGLPHRRPGPAVFWLTAGPHRRLLRVVPAVVHRGCGDAGPHAAAQACRATR